MGGGWLRLVWDTEVADHVIIDTVPADNAIGEWRLGVLQAVTFFTEYSAGSARQTDIGWGWTPAAKTIVVRHLERHEPVLILHGLYQGDFENLGFPIPLSEAPPTAMLASAKGATLCE